MDTAVHTTIATDLTSFHLRRALRAIDASWDGSVLQFWQRAEALAGLERFEEAESTILAVANAERLVPAERARAAAFAVRYRVHGGGPVDPLLGRLSTALELVEGQGGPDDETARALEAIHLERMRLFARKRVRVLADRELAAARAVAGDGADAALAQARLHLAFDERIAARAAYEHARSLGAEREARLGLAHVAFLLGDFAAAEASLEGYAWGPDDLEVRRRRIDLLEAAQRWEEVARELEHVVACSPQGMYVLWDRLEQAAALERAGDTVGARTRFAAIVEDASDGRDHRVARARRALTLLARSRADGEAPPRRTRLQGFPTTAQLRNHCGPASCELYLRFLGRDADQLEIGSEILIDADAGTTFDRMRSYLERTGLRTLRIEAPLPVLKALLDLGVPVMLQETYAASGHATVAIGYDDARDVVEVQDPMTHAIRETPYEELDDLLDMSNHGALIAVASDDHATLAAIEKAGVRECRYLVQTDRAYVALAAGQLDEADKLLDAALAERRDYELAWMCRFHVATARLDREETPENRVRVHHIVEEAASIWPEDDWVRSLGGSIAFRDGDYGRACDEYARACAAERGNPRTWRSLGHARLRAGDAPSARDALEHALELDPADLFTNELAAQARFLTKDRAGARIASEIALALGPANAFNHLVHADILAERGDLEGALAAYARALELDPARGPTTLLRRCELLEKLGRYDELDALLAGAGDALEPVDRDRRRFEALMHGGRVDDAEKLASALAASPATARLGDELCARVAWRRGDLDAAGDRAKALLARAPHGIALAILGDRIAAAGNQNAALLHLGAAATLAPEDPIIALALGETLAALGQNDAARTAFARALRRTRAANIIHAALEGLANVGAVNLALEILDELEASPGRARDIRSARIALLTEIVWAPGMAAPRLREEAARGSDHPLVIAQGGIDRFGRSLEDEVEGERLLREAIAALPEHRYPRWQLAGLLIARGRAEDALALVPERDHFVAVRIVVDGLCKQERFDEARAMIASFAAEVGLSPNPRLELVVAMAAGEHARALELSRIVGAAYGEDENDARLDEGELRQFLLLLALGREEEAISFGRAQAGSARSLGLLAHRALAAGSLPVAIPLAEHALQIDPDEAYAIHVLGRAAEQRGDAAAARTLYERAGKADAQWHAYLEELARLSIAEGDASAALDFAERAVTTGGHMCFFACAIRAQARLVAGDLAGARQDAERAYRLGAVESRDRTNLDAWAVCALLRGDVATADALFARYLADTANAGPLDAARVAALRAASTRASA